MMRSHCSGVTSMKLSNESLPAAFTSTSTCPSSLAHALDRGVDRGAVGDVDRVARSQSHPPR